MDNELFSAIVDAAQRGVIVEFFVGVSKRDIAVKVDGIAGSSCRTINTTDPALMVSAIRQLTEQVCR